LRDKGLQGFLEIRLSIGGLEGFSRLVPRMIRKNSTTNWQMTPMIVDDAIVYGLHMTSLNLYM